MGDYLRQTRSPTYAFWAALPLLLGYELLILLANAGAAQSVEVGAAVWLKVLLSRLGAAGHLGLGLVVLVVGLVILVAERSEERTLRPGYFAGMGAEALAYAIIAPVPIIHLLRRLQVGLATGEVEAALWSAAAGSLGEASPAMRAALSLGAGLYEELVFRVLLFGGLAWVLQGMMGERRRVPAVLVAAVVGALLFSAVHYLGPLGDPFALGSFTFRFLLGLIFTGLYVLRGFGIAAWTHALYDLMVLFVWQRGS